MLVTIHQPNFMPWYPFFQKMEEADIFVILKNCQFEKNGFQNRFNINKNWYTMSTKKGLDPICTKSYLNPQKDWQKIKNKLPEYHDTLCLFDEDITDNLSETNINIIQRINSLLGINTTIEQDFPTDKRSTSRLVEICRTYQATKYLSGPSGKSYLDIEEFNDQNIEVVYANSDPIKEPILKVLKERIIHV